MKRQRLLMAMVAGILVLSFTVGLRADTKIVISPPVPRVVATPRIGLGIWIGTPGQPLCHRPAPRPVVTARPWRRRFIHLGHPRVETVVVRPPAVKVVHPPVAGDVVVHHAPAVTVATPAPVEAGSITVWVTNSNGSRTSVRLTRQGPWYTGPRGEYYTEMPTNEQLRVAYGF